MKSIMIVDDEENLLELVKAILENEGFKVVKANSGTECLRKLKKMKPDLILMDIMMPKMGGVETVKKIRGEMELKDMKIVFLTVVKFPEVGNAVMKDLGVIDYITKPFNNKDLVWRVKKVLGEAKS